MSEQDDNYYFDDAETVEGAGQQASPPPSKAAQQAELDKQRYQASLQQPQAGATLVDEIVTGVVNKVTQQQEQAQQQAVINEYAQRYPDLASKAHYIAPNVERLRLEAESQGKKVDFKTLLDTAIAVTEKETGMKLTQAQQNEALRNGAFSPDMGSVPAKAQQNPLAQAVDKLDINALLSFSDNVLHGRA
jgi:hypothetical protein